MALCFLDTLNIQPLWVLVLCILGSLSVLVCTLRFLNWVCVNFIRLAKNLKKYRSSATEISMASSSSSPVQVQVQVQVQQKYQVFLSFRGEDTRLNFTSHLREALQRKGIGYFIDDKLKRGEEISQALLTAIQESKISIIVLSKDYASSSWCLKELSEILECRKKTNGQIVIPIFYHVDPSDVRNQKGKSFEDAFAKHQERFKTDVVERWRAALKEVGNLSGHHIKPNDRCESEHIKNIVEDISKKLFDNTSNDFRGLVGIESVIKEIESMLCFKLADVGILGIYGMGGIGKTTIAEVIYHRNSAGFERCCYFLQNVREKSEKNGWICLRDELICKILEESNLNIGTNLLSPSICDRLRRKKVLIVLDDVDKSMQLDLFRGKHWFGPGSRIIVTSRDKQVLRLVVDEIYEVKGLNDDKALQLLSLSAFKQSHPKEGFMELSKKVVHYAKGVPLALSVLGSALYDRSKSFWEDELNKLKEIPNPEIDKILKISLDGLDHEVKDIFLDIACFFKGHNRDYVIDKLDGHYRSVLSGISVLIDKSLITFSDNMINMHDLLQQMAWNIICQESKEPGQRSRLWTPEDIKHVLKNNTGTGSIEGMLLDMSKISGEVCMSPTAFAKMHNLKLLKFYYSRFREREVFVSQQCLESLPDALTFLHWDGYPSKSLPSNFCPENLVELSMCNSRVKRLWNGVQNLVKLKRLDLSQSQHLIEIPDLSRATDLETLYLSWTAIEEVPSSIGCLTRLWCLDMQGCKRLKRLPSSICKLKLLHRLNLGGCLKLEGFPEILETMEGLETLYLNNTSIEKLPSSIEHLVGLKRLWLDNSKKLENLPSSIRKLNSLGFLSLIKCSNITKFPEIPRNVVSLHLSETAIEQIPSSIECHSKLRELYLKKCTKLGSLPRYIFKSISLHVKVSGISKLKVIQQHLGIVKAINLHPLDGTPEIGNMRSNFKWSTYTSFSINLSLNDLLSLRNSIGNMKSLEELNVSGSSVFEELPDNLEILKSLTKLRLSFCNLTKFSSRLTFISSLRELNLSGNNFEAAPASIKQLLKLERLDLSYCKRLQSLPELPPHLQYLNAFDCTSLKAVSGVFPFSHHWNHLSDHWNHLTFIFGNCINLDQKAILAETQLHIQRIGTEQLKIHHPEIYPKSSFSIYFPGSEIPEWFSCQNLGSSVTTLWPPYLHDRDHNFKFVGFALCIVVALDDSTEYSTVECRCNFKVNGHNSFACILDESPSDEPPRFIGSDHVFLAYWDWDWEDYGESNYHLNEASFEFSIHFRRFGNPVDSSILVKKCGVHLLYCQVPNESDGESDVEGESESDGESESEGESDGESDAGDCNPFMIQPSSRYDPMVEDGTTTKRHRDDYCYDEAEPSGNFRCDEEEEPHPKRLK